MSRVEKGEKVGTFEGNYASILGNDTRTFLNFLIFGNNFSDKYLCLWGGKTWTSTIRERISTLNDPQWTAHFKENKIQISPYTSVLIPCVVPEEAELRMSLISSVRARSIGRFPLLVLLEQRHVLYNERCLTQFCKIIHCKVPFLLRELAFTYLLTLPQSLFKT